MGCGTVDPPPEMGTVCTPRAGSTRVVAAGAGATTRRGEGETPGPRGRAYGGDDVPACGSAGGSRDAQRTRGNAVRSTSTSVPAWRIVGGGIALPAANPNSVARVSTRR